MGKYSTDAKLLLERVGGKDNIAAVSHCVTRMRFVLNDESKADIKGIEAIPSTKGTFTQAGQFQVIIGNDVADYFNDFKAISGIEGVSKDAAKTAAKKNQNFIQRAMSNLAEIFAPLIPAIIVGGLILGFRNIIGEIKMVNDGTQTLTQVSVFWNGMNNFLWLIGEAVFHFLPVAIVWSITRKMGTTQSLGIVLGITLVSPQLLNAYAVASTAAADIPFWDFGFMTVEKIGYQAQVLPAIMAGFVLVYLEKGLRKITPVVVQMIVVPFFSLLLSVMAAHFILGPIGWVIGNWLSAVVSAGLSSTFNWLFAAVFGFAYAPLVITGLHHMSNAIDLQLISAYNGTNLWPMIALSNIAQGSAVLAMIFLQKKDVKAKEVSVPACISCYLGVTEPAMFGVNLKYGFPFICAMIGSSIAAVISIVGGVYANSIGVGGLPGILSIQPQHMLTFALAMAVAIAIPFVLTFTMGKRKLPQLAAAALAEAETGEISSETVVDTAVAPLAGDAAVATPAAATKPAIELAAFLDGKVVPIEDVPDKVFSTKMLGDGIAIDPSNEDLIAPCDGEINVVMDESFHACGLLLENGMSLLFHIGLDTVAMKGDGFVPHVQVGDKITKGQKLISFSLEKIKAAGFSPLTMLIAAEMGENNRVRFFGEGMVKAGQDKIGIINE